MHADAIIHSLQGYGHRMTTMRRFVLSTFDGKKTPISANELVAELTKRKLHPNKTTVYRELNFLLKQKIIKSIDFGDGSKRYELASGDHHHHLICTTCNHIEDLELNHDFDKEGSRLGRQKGFKVSGHSLEFFGTCKNCQ